LWFKFSGLFFNFFLPPIFAAAFFFSSSSSWLTTFDFQSSPPLLPASAPPHTHQTTGQRRAKVPSRQPTARPSSNQPPHRRLPSTPASALYLFFLYLFSFFLHFSLFFSIFLLFFLMALSLCPLFVVYLLLDWMG
jgi:hypothetical protein